MMKYYQQIVIRVICVIGDVCGDVHLFLPDQHFIVEAVLSIQLNDYILKLFNYQK